MPFGAAESMNVHAALGEKICMLDHFSLYAEQCQDPTLKQMIMRHIGSAIHSYNQLVAYTHEYRQAQPMMNQINVTPESIQYGLRSPQPTAPSMQGGRLNDQQIASAVLNAHKNSAKNQLSGALESADPNVRQMLLNGSIACTNQSYEVFLFMNQRGWYQVPTLNDHTAKTLLHHFQMVGQPTQIQQPWMGMHPAQIQVQRQLQQEYHGNPFLM
ncbi:MAG TPA: spore coat protein [Bacillota bacterium]|nr:spore coat protein [Bacillota bacterium]